MRKNYKLVISYDGSAYNGWQKQGNTKKTVQGILEDILKEITGCETEIYGSGRTDAGAHARGQTANFFMEEDLVCEQIRELINQKLPEDIRILEVIKEETDFHARYKAAGKRYSYTIWDADYPPVFERKYVYEVLGKPDIIKMRKAAVKLIGSHDFRGFSSEKNKEKSTVREITDISIERRKEKIIIYYTGNGFLYNMVRIMTGTLLEIGLGKRKEDSIQNIIANGDRKEAGFTAPSNGLCLEEVYYER